MTKQLRIGDKRYDIAGFCVDTPRRDLPPRAIAGVVPLEGSFDISQFPMTDATLTIERLDGQRIVVDNATLCAFVEDGKVMVRFSGTTTDDVVAASDPA